MISGELYFLRIKNEGILEPSDKISDTLRLTVQALIKDKYYDVNLQHLLELLAVNEGIQVKREPLRKCHGCFCNDRNNS